MYTIVKLDFKRGVAVASDFCEIPLDRIKGIVKVGYAIKQIGPFFFPIEHHSECPTCGE